MVLKQLAKFVKRTVERNLSQQKQVERKTDKGTKPIYIPPGNEFAKWITRDIPKIIEGLYKKEIESLEVHASAGQSSWVTSPWIVILDPKTCTHDRKTGQSHPMDDCRAIAV